MQMIFSINCNKENLLFFLYLICFSLSACKQFLFYKILLLPYISLIHLFTHIKPTTRSLSISKDNNRKFQGQENCIANIYIMGNNNHFLSSVIELGSIYIYFFFYIVVDRKYLNNKRLKKVCQGLMPVIQKIPEKGRKLLDSNVSVQNGVLSTETFNDNDSIDKLV